MTTLISLIVGAHFRPPAKVLLANMPSGMPLTLAPEPSNEYDENAVAVFLTTEDLLNQLDAEQTQSLEDELSGMGFDLDMLREQEAWHLGYLPAEANKERIKLGYAANTELLPHVLEGHNKATFSVDGAGKPIVIFEAP